MDQKIGQILAYGALLKSSRLSEADYVLVANHFLEGCNTKNYIQPIAFGFLHELLVCVSFLLSYEFSNFVCKLQTFFF